MAWMDELAPLSVLWPDGRKLKLQFPEEPKSKAGEVNYPELQIKLTECFQLKEHPRLCEGKLPVKFWLAAPDGKRIDFTLDWPSFKATTYPKIKSTLQKKYPLTVWP